MKSWSTIPALNNLLEQIGLWFIFACNSVWSAIRVLPRPASWLRPFDAIFLGGLPLATVTGLALGIVIWMHSYTALVKTGTGATDYLPTVLAAAVLLELAPIGAGLIVASRTGAQLAAELASMRASEQIDALQLLGISPSRRLFGPRVLAATFATPLLHVVIAILASAGGFVAESIAGQTTWLKYQTNLLRELILIEVLAAASKTVVFGLLISTTACWLGINAENGSEGIGRAATQSVVVCVLLVLAADVMLVGIIQILI